MSYIISDLALENIPGFEVSADAETGEGTTKVGYGCIRLAKVDKEHLQHYRYRFACFDELFNTLMHTTGIGWNVYAPTEYCSNETSHYYLFVYEYLNIGEHIVIYMPDKKAQFHPETLTSFVDVSAKKGGYALVDYAWLNRDVLYHFFKSRPYVVKHDTGLLLRMGQDIPNPQPVYSGFIPSTPVTVGELMRIAGNSVGIVSIHDFDKVGEARDILWNRSFKEVFREPFQPLEVVLTDDAKREIMGELDAELLAERPKSFDEDVVLYAVHSAGSNCCEELCIGDNSVLATWGMLTLAIFVRPHDKRPKDSDFR